MQLSFMGAAREVGRSGVLLETGKSKVVFDYGMKMSDEGSSQPKFPLPIHGFLDAVLLSHSHLDHSGAIPYLFQSSEPKVLAHTAGVPITELLLKDSIKIASLNKKKCYTSTQLKRMLRNTDGISYGKNYQATSDISLKAHDAGHILGASYFEVEAEGHNMIYSGDFKLGETKLHKGAALPPKTEALVVEATYGDRLHPPREQIEREFVEAVRGTLENNGSVLLPCFAVGRTQEMITLLYDNKIDAPVFMDGMSRAVSEIYMDFPELINDYDRFYEAMKWCNWIVSPRQRDSVFNEPSVVVATAGMLSGGPAVRYVQELKNVDHSAVFFTGYQVPGTPGRRLLNDKQFEGRECSVDCSTLDIRHFDFSAHADSEGIHKFIKSASPNALFVNHGEEEQCEALRQWAEDEIGCYAFSPKLGEKYRLEDYV